MRQLKKLNKDFYRRHALAVAPELLGKLLVRKSEDKLLSGMIVETEAYDGANDAASHSFGGRTKRNSVMFEEGGLLYVYFTYGMYYCCNIVTGKKDSGQAVLIRALEPVDGIGEMNLNRFSKYDMHNI